MDSIEIGRKRFSYSGEPSFLCKGIYGMKIFLIDMCKSVNTL